MADQTTRLHGQTAIVTGGASGIGRATCQCLAREGAHVVVVDVNPQRVAEAIEEIQAAWGTAGRGAGFLGLALDVRSESDMQAMAQRALDSFGRIDILVACAGILRGTGSSPKPLAAIAVEEWRQVIDTNLTGMFLSNRAVLPAMLKQRRGNIVNLSSVQGRQGRAHDAPYCASKFGVIGMSEALAEEVRSQGIRVQIVLPDAVATPMWQQNGPVPMPTDALPPERVADLIVYLILLPEDTTLGAVTIAPFRTRRRLGAKKEQAGVAAE